MLARDSHSLEDCASFTQTLEENNSTAPTTVLLVQYKQQANPLLLTHNYTPLVISRNNKIKQLTIIKPMQTGINREKYTFCNIKSLEHLKKLIKWPRPLFRPKTNHTYHQKQNSSRETVPFTLLLNSIIISCLVRRRPNNKENPCSFSQYFEYLNHDLNQNILFVSCIEEAHLEN